jgi:hypothetical protein
MNRWNVWRELDALRGSREMTALGNALDCGLSLRLPQSGEEELGLVLRARWVPPWSRGRMKGSIRGGSRRPGPGDSMHSFAVNKGRKQRWLTLGH